MIPAAFDYARPATLDEALELIAGADPSIRVLAGGQSLIPLMKLRLARPERLVDVGRIAELRGVRDLHGGGLAIGALTTWATLLEDSRVRCVRRLLRRDPGDRRRAGPQPRHDRRQPRPRRPGERHRRAGARAASSSSSRGLPPAASGSSRRRTSSPGRSRPSSNPTRCSSRSACRRPAHRRPRPTAPSRSPRPATRSPASPSRYAAPGRRPSPAASSA